jgi:hypothetical protein
MNGAVDPEAILNCLVDGASIAEAARRFSVPESEIKAIVDEETARYYDPATMRQRWMLAERRMLSLELQFYRLAKEKDDHVAGALAVKANERRATLSGANAPIGHVVQLTSTAPLVQESSTEYYCRMLDLLDGKSGPPMASEDEPNGRAKTPGEFGEPGKPN